MKTQDNHTVRAAGAALKAPVAQTSLFFQLFNIRQRLKVLLALITLGTPLVNAATFTVTTEGDDGPGSFRQAILDANANPGLDTIVFNIPRGGYRSLQPLSALPIITDPVIIDATTQPEYAGLPRIERNGTSAGAGASPTFAFSRVAD